MRISDWSSDVCSSDLLLQARRLAGEAVELAVAGKDARRPSDRQAAQEAAQKVMGVGRKGEARCIVEPPNAQTEMARDAALHRRHHLVKDKIGRAHVCTPVTNAHLVCRLMLEKKQKH